MSDTSSELSRIQVLTRALQVLFMFSADEPSLSLNELAERTGVSKASLLRILRTLEMDQILTRSEDTYRLGPRVLSLGNVYLETLNVPDVARPHMAALAVRLRMSTNLAILDGMEVVYIAIEHGWRDIGVQSEIGGRHPANATALGKVLLAALDDEELERRVRHGQLVRLTHRTIVDPDELLADLRNVRAKGYAVDDEERGIGIRCIAAPIVNHTKQTVAALSLAGPIFDLETSDIEVRAADVIATAGDVSFDIGGVR